MNELNIKINQQPALVEINFEEIKTSLEAELSGYENAVFTTESKDMRNQHLRHCGRKRKSLMRLAKD